MRGPASALAGWAAEAGLLAGIGRTGMEGELRETGIALAAVSVGKGAARFAIGGTAELGSRLSSSLLCSPSWMSEGSWARVGADEEAGRSPILVHSSPSVHVMRWSSGESSPVATLSLSSPHLH